MGCFSGNIGSSKPGRNPTKSNLGGGGIKPSGPSADGRPETRSPSPAGARRPIPAPKKRPPQEEVVQERPLAHYDVPKPPRKGPHPDDPLRTSDKPHPEKYCRCIKCKPDQYDDDGELKNAWMAFSVKHGLGLCPYEEYDCRCPFCSVTRGCPIRAKGHSLPKRERCLSPICRCYVGCYGKLCGQCQLCKS